MEKSAHTVLKSTLRSLTRSRAAFSLVEVTLAIGIVAFAFTSIFGLLPVGLGMFRQALNISITTQIAQRTLSALQQTDFDIVIDRTNLPNYPLKPPANFTFTAPLVKSPSFTKYDDTGAKVGSTVYWVNTRIMPTTDLPGIGNSAKGADNPNIATVTIQVAFNPGDRPLAMDAKLPNLWSGAYQGATNTGAVPIYTYTAQIAKSQ